MGRCRVPIELDDATYAAARMRAGDQDMSLPRYLAWVVRQQHNVDLDENGRVDTIAPRVRELAQQRYMDGDIATILNISRTAVTAKREAAGIPRNRRDDPLTLPLSHYLHEEGHLR